METISHENSLKESIKYQSGISQATTVIADEFRISISQAIRFKSVLKYGF
jgi:hypothetical protein